MVFQSFEGLEVWQRGCRLSVDIFWVFENCRKYSLKDQIERAGLSIPSNIADFGNARGFASLRSEESAAAAVNLKI